MPLLPGTPDYLKSHPTHFMGLPMSFGLRSLCGQSGLHRKGRVMGDKSARGEQPRGGDENGSVTAHLKGCKLIRPVLSQCDFGLGQAHRFLSHDWTMTPFCSAPRRRVHQSGIMCSSETDVVPAPAFHARPLRFGLCA